MSGCAPILGKRPPDRRDYRPMTWAVFLCLRAWAKATAEKHGARVFLVGSALTKTEPRDIDLAIVLPTAEIEARFGPLPAPGTPAMQQYMDALHAAIVDDYIVAQIAVPERVLDVKLCPAAWWPEKDRLLLASPPGDTGEAWP